MSNIAVVSTPSGVQAAGTEAPARMQSFRLFQPRNLASWVFVWFLITGALSTFHYFRPAFEAVGTATMWGFIGFGIYTLPWLWFLHQIDHWTRLPGRLLLAAFLWGAMPATFLIAITANDSLMSIFNKAISATFAEDWGAGLAAPFDEELAKGIGVLLLIVIASGIIRRPFDGFVVGGFVGLGFQIFEDVSYVISNAVVGFGADQVGAVTEILVLRGVTGIFSHTLYSAVFGAGLVYLLGTDKTPARRGLGLGMMFAAMFFHGAWDAMGAIGGVLGIHVLLVVLAVVGSQLIGVIVVLRLLSRMERPEIRELLAPEVARGTISEEEMTALVGGRKARKRYLKAAPGHHDRKTHRHILTAASDLGRALIDSEGQETPAVIHARSEISRLRGAGPVA